MYNHILVLLKLAWLAFDLGGLRRKLYRAANTRFRNYGNPNRNGILQMEGRAGTRPSVIFIEPPDGIQKEEWMSIDEDISVAATITDLEICQAVCEQDQAIKVDNSDGDECVEANPPTNAEMRQTLDILKHGVQHRSTNV
ncbi:hypothetical protein AVEN_59743-1 [Araneus ventricosus]|uniref:Uncharacterized protein n=1 Tax=Araneus ventricosus TaxID=182803 RepID=A0A4Y2BMU3_ARAVE|nr:hypothetical protein AVEN_59743-1 [Araneus ventricosus]